MEEPSAVTIDIDYGRQWRFCTEAQYTGGSLVRKTYDNYQDFSRALSILKERASTVWVKGYRIEILTQWNEWT